MSYFLPKLYHLWSLRSKDIVRKKGFPYLILSTRIISSVQNGVIVLLESPQVLSGFSQAHPSAFQWHADIANGITCLFKPENVTRESGTEFVWVDEEKHLSVSSFYEVQPPQECVREITYREKVGQLLLWDNRRYTEQEKTGLYVTKRILHRKSEKWPTQENPLRVYATFVDSDMKRLFINTDF